MTPTEAALILDPDTTLVALAEVEYYAGFNGKEARIAACEEACRIAADALRDIQKGPVCETCIRSNTLCLLQKPCQSWEWRGNREQNH